MEWFKFGEDTVTFVFPWGPILVLLGSFISYKMARRIGRKIKERRKSDLRDSTAAKRVREKEYEARKKEYEQILVLLAPYLDTGDSSSRIDDYILEDRLPREWYEFWKDLIHYPARRRLFIEKVTTTVTRGRKDLHPVTQVPLTSKQATLLARALGGNDPDDVNRYASDLSQFVVMEGENHSAYVIRNAGNGKNHQGMYSKNPDIPF